MRSLLESCCSKPFAASQLSADTDRHVLTNFSGLPTPTAGKYLGGAYLVIPGVGLGEETQVDEEGWAAFRLRANNLHRLVGVQHRFVLILSIAGIFRLSPIFSAPLRLPTIFPPLFLRSDLGDWRCWLGWLLPSLCRVRLACSMKGRHSLRLTAASSLAVVCLFGVVADIETGVRVKASKELREGDQLRRFSLNI